MRRPNYFAGVMGTKIGDFYSETRSYRHPPVGLDASNPAYCHSQNPVSLKLPVKILYIHLRHCADYLPLAFQMSGDTRSDARLIPHSIRDGSFNRVSPTGSSLEIQSETSRTSILDLNQTRPDPGSEPSSHQLSRPGYQKGSSQFRYYLLLSPLSPSVWYCTCCIVRGDRGFLN
jgi:hypothetical protein